MAPAKVFLTRLGLGFLGNSPHVLKLSERFIQVYLGILRVFMLFKSQYTVAPKSKPFPSQTFPKNIHERLI